MRLIGFIRARARKIADFFWGKRMSVENAQPGRVPAAKKAPAAKEGPPAKKRPAAFACFTWLHLCPKRTLAIIRGV